MRTHIAFSLLPFAFLSMAAKGSGCETTEAPIVTPPPDAAANDAQTGVAPGGSCNPIATHPTRLATLLGVGEDPSGTLYVADVGGIPAYPNIVRVFVPSHGSLVRQDVIGSGSAGGASGEDLETFQSADGSVPARDLVIQLAGGTATSMTLGPEGSGKLGIDGRDGGTTTPLTILNATAVSGMPVVDLPGVVQYVADATNGESLVVTAPLEDDEGTSAFHLFYGTAGAMLERPIVSFNQSMSGYPSIGFTVGSATYIMSIASVQTPDSGLGEAPGPVTLTGGGGGAVAFTLRLPTPKSLDGFSFTCLGALASAGSADAGALAACSVSPQGLDRSCTKDTDCVAVGFGDFCVDPCLGDPKSIVNGAINASALGTYGAAVALAQAAAASDPDAGRTSCGEGSAGDASALARGWDGSFAACSAGLCVATR